MDIGQNLDSPLLEYCESGFKSPACFPEDTEGVIKTGQQPISGNWNTEGKVVYYRICDTIYELTVENYPMGDPQHPDITQFLNQLKK